MSITEFLEARIAEDERWAREEDEDYADTTLLPTYDSKHQANWNTERVLAECAAKRAIIKLAEQATADVKAYDDYEWQGTVKLDEPYAGQAIVMTLAAVYKDHPDYQQEWGA